ncbi:MAG: hypothetical protein HXX18_00300 [Bacteroidetes bacterium]|nr:hypothetical protein [Bacteroidota bacterium]
MKKLMIFFFVTVFVASIGLLSCKKDDSSPALKTGVVSGYVYSKKGIKLGAVKIFVQDYPSCATVSNMNGYFSFAVPVGAHKLVIQSGSGHIFMSVINVNITENQAVLLTPQQTVLNQVGNLAYVAGYYDKIQTIIIDSLGYSATQLQISALDSFSNISGYQAIFLNCGKSDLLDSLKYSNLASFVANCGSIYASDWAVEYLIGDGNNKSFSQRTKDYNAHLSLKQTNTCAPKIGGFINDTILCAMKTGQSGYIDSIDIISPAIQTLLGKTKMTIHYDLGAWYVIQQLGPQFTVLLQDNNLATSYGPLAVLCHYGITCNQGGNILYTTFHNEPQSGVSPDVQKILQYFILNL